MNSPRFAGWQYTAILTLTPLSINRTAHVSWHRERRSSTVHSSRCASFSSSNTTVQAGSRVHLWLERPKVVQYNERAFDAGKGKRTSERGCPPSRDGWRRLTSAPSFLNNVVASLARLLLVKAHAAVSPSARPISLETHAIQPIGQNRMPIMRPIAPGLDFSWCGPPVTGQISALTNCCFIGWPPWGTCCCMGCMGCMGCEP